MLTGQGAEPAHGWGSQVRLLGIITDCQGSQGSAAAHFGHQAMLSSSISRVWAMSQLPLLLL